MEENVKTLGDYFAILRRRKWRIIIPAVVLAVVSVVVAVALPSVYRSSATILIEEQEIPQELVRSTVTSYADQRIQVISQRVMTRSNLGRIIDEFGLYADDREHKTREELVQELGESISLDMVSADVIDPRSGRPRQATIAFTLSFDSTNPRVAQRVTNELASLFLNENIKTRREQAAEALDFFVDEARRLSQQVSELEVQLAEFKQQNAGRLPEQASLNLQLMERTERELEEAFRRMQSLGERKIFLESELSQTSPYQLAFDAVGNRVPSAEEKLRVLKSEYISAQSLYNQHHPDLVRMRREIAALENEVTAAGDDQAGVLKLTLEQRQAEYQSALKQYSAGHPDVIKLKHAVDQLKTSLTEMSSANGSMPTNSIHSHPDNPVFITLKAQLQAVETELVSVQSQTQTLKTKLADYESRLLAAPEVERAYRSLTRDYESAHQKYQEIKAKQMEAQVAQALEREAKAERFTLLEPPQLPEEPIKPNRPAILFLGFVFAMGGGLGIAAVGESVDRSVRGARAVTALLNQAPLGVIPIIENEDDRRRRRFRVASVFAVLVISAAIGLVAIHNLWMPLDVAWFALENKLGIR